MRVEKVNEKFLLCGGIIPKERITKGQLWARADGSAGLVMIDEVIGDDVKYKWLEKEEWKYHTKDSFSFQCRYCLLLNSEELPYWCQND